MKKKPVRLPRFCKACRDEIPPYEPPPLNHPKEYRVARPWVGFCSEECWDAYTTAREAAMKAFKLDWKAKQEGREKCPACERWLR